MSVATSLIASFLIGTNADCTVSDFYINNEKIIVNKDADFFKEIGDRFFKVKSLKEVVDSLIKKNDDKAFYNYLIKNLKEQGIEENVFVQKVCEMIYRKEDMSKLLTFLQKTFQN